LNTNIENPAACTMRSVLRLLNPRNVRLAEIRWQIIEACGECAIKEGNVREWFPVFKGSSTNVHDGGRSRSSKSSSGKFLRVLHSLDLGPSDYHLFLKLKFLACQSRKGNQRTKDVLQDWLKGLTTSVDWE
jgi:hypothetical protein